MNARKLSAILSIVGALLLIGGMIYFIVGYIQTKNNLVGVTEEEEITAIAQPFINGMLIWVLGNYLLTTFVNGVAAMSYAMKSNYFKGDKLFVVKIILAFVPIILCGVFFLITQSLR